MHRTAVSLVAISALGAGPAYPMDTVVASIKPVHSLVAGVMAGVGEPELLVSGAASPHDYALRPSEGRILQEAGLIFWIGPDMEMFLADALDTIARDNRSVALGETEGVQLLPYRDEGAATAHAVGHDDERGGTSEDDHRHDAHEHGDHQEPDAAAHNQDDGGHQHGGNGTAEHDRENHDHDWHGHEGHEGGEYDMHVWLDPLNAKAMVTKIEEALSEADPENAALYRENAKALSARLDALTGEISAMLSPVADRPFIVFHDAYQYFEKRFGLDEAGAITINPQIDPSAQRIAEMQSIVAESGAVCVFSEPQFDPRIVDVVAEGSDAGSDILDPIGSSIDQGPKQYFELMRTMAQSFKRCLASTQ